MPTQQTFIETLAIIAIAVMMEALSDYLKDPTLGTWAATVFGGGMGYLLHGARTGS